MLSFLGTASIVGAGAYVYIQKDALIESAKEAATAAATEAVVGALPGLVGGLMQRFLNFLVLLVVQFHLL